MRKHLCAVATGTIKTGQGNLINYQAAIEADLPIGSGEIESAHRYIIQERLKLPGAWWKIDNAFTMLSLRLLRANNYWQEYWDNFLKQLNILADNHF